MAKLRAASSGVPKRVVLDTVGQTAVQVDELGDVVLVLAGTVVEVDVGATALVVHAATANESAPRTMAIPRFRFGMVSSLRQSPGLRKGRMSRLGPTGKTGPFHGPDRPPSIFSGTDDHLDQGFRL